MEDGVFENWRSRDEPPSEGHNSGAKNEAAYGIEPVGKLGVKISYAMLPWRGNVHLPVGEASRLGFALYILLHFIAMGVEGASVKISSLMRMLGYANANSRATRYGDVINALYKLATAGYLQIQRVNGAAFDDSMDIKASDTIQYELIDKPMKAHSKQFLYLEIDEARKLIQSVPTGGKSKFDTYLLLYCFIKSFARKVVAHNAQCLSRDIVGYVCWPSYRAIEKSTGISHNSACAMLRELTQNGLLWSWPDLENRMTFYAFSEEVELFNAAKEAFHKTPEGQKRNKAADNDYVAVWDEQARRLGVKQGYRKSKIG